LASVLPDFQAQRVKTDNNRVASYSPARESGNLGAMQRPLIHIRTVLAEIELPDGEGRPKAFSLRYYKTDGTPGSKAAVQKAGRSGGSTGGSGKFHYRVKEKGVLLLVDCQTKQSFALRISLLTHYNDRRILHG